VELITEHSGRVLILALNRPDRMNAVSLPLYRQLGEALRSAERDHNVRAIVLTGAGRAFCVGADLVAYGDAEPSPAQKLEYVRAAQSAHRLMQRSTRPIVAAINGHAIGAGLELALSCDFVIVSDAAKLRFPEVTLGTFVGGGTTYSLPARVGMLRAKSLLMLAEFFSPQDAVSWGIANRAVPAEEVLPAALALARELATRAPRSLAHTKRLLDAASSLDARRALVLEARALLDCMSTNDWKEGINAFHDKRPPQFSGE
jgi:enoyl-CoA hydratase